MRSHWRRVVILLTAAMAGGCDGAGRNGTPATGPAAMLPRQVRIHAFSSTRPFAVEGGINGIDLRVEALDEFGDTTKAFGEFRFEMYEYRRHSEDPRGQRLNVWVVALEDPKENLAHWDGISRTYRFRLGWASPLPAGRQFVMAVVHSSPYGPRLFDQRVLVSGE